MSISVIFLSNLPKDQESRSEGLKLFWYIPERWSDIYVGKFCQDWRCVIYSKLLYVQASLALLKTRILHRPVMLRTVFCYYHQNWLE